MVTKYPANDLSDLMQQVCDQARNWPSDFTPPATAPAIVVSPYRFNPLGAHVDHQGGPVLARTINQYTLLPFWVSSNQPIVQLFADAPECEPAQTQFQIGQTDSKHTWVRYAQAAAAALNRRYPLKNGMIAMVHGTLIGAGLSSSASVILGYLTALAGANALGLGDKELVELTRQVENEYMGLNNGIQDQMSIVYGSADGLSVLDVESATSRTIADPSTIGDVCWVVCYSGFSRELIHSDFNIRVSECQEAARFLDQRASTLGDLGRLSPDDPRIDKLPTPLANRARHYFSEVIRVDQGALAWTAGDWTAFGQLMNQSCDSSIRQYESGSQPLIDLHQMASGTDGIYGSRFSGGGYGGCLIALCDRSFEQQAIAKMQTSFQEKYPEKAGVSRVFSALPESRVRIEQLPS